MDASEARSELVMDIISGKLKERDFEHRITDLENNYGKEAFTSYYFEKIDMPWSISYYKELEKKAVSGAGSKEFLEYLYEVKMYVEKENEKGVNKLFSDTIELVSKNPVIFGEIVLFIIGVIVYFISAR